MSPQCVYLHSPFAKASCSSQIETARAVTQEMGDDASHKSGIKDWAKIDSKNSERDVNRVVQLHGTSLKIPITEIDVGGKTFHGLTQLLGFVTSSTMACCTCCLGFVLTNDTLWEGHGRNSGPNTKA